jgi:hypothetical protein
MMRLTWVAGAIVAMVLAAAPAAAAEPPLLAQNDALVQCVTDCVKQIGRDDIETCQMRCSHLANTKQVDCMGNYKSCKRACAKDRKCKKACKKRLTKCR